MSVKSTGQIRRSQIITTYGPGALIDLPRDSAIVAGTDSWRSALERIDEPRVRRALMRMTGVSYPELRVPPTPDPAKFWETAPRGIDAYRFPEWFVVQEAGGGSAGRASPASGPAKAQRRGRRERSRRLVHRSELDKGRKFDKRPVVATRFVMACPAGHVDDFPWRDFVHGGPDRSKESGTPAGASGCVGHLWLDETGATGELATLRVRCSCGKSRLMTEANVINTRPLGTCRGNRPWLGPNAREHCDQPGRLLIRTATNAFFPLLVRALSIPDRGEAVDAVVKELWEDLRIVDDALVLSIMKRKPEVAEKLHGVADDDVLAAIARRQDGAASDDRPAKAVEIEAMLTVPEGFGDDVPIDPDFHARKLRPGPGSDGFRPPIETVVQVHRQREVLALAGFTRLEAPMPDVDGEYDDDVERAEISVDPSWYPAVENRGEGVLLHFSADSIRRWRARPAVDARVTDLEDGYRAFAEWRNERRAKPLPAFPGGTYVMLHTLSHLLLQSVSDRCGYPAASIRERVYVDKANGRYGILLYTASPDAEGTLGGLVQQARRIDDHLERALRAGALCSNDPVCAQHSPGDGIEERWLHGAACHGCTLVAETSCEMRNDYLDRALVVPTLAARDAAFFRDRLSP